MAREADNRPAAPAGSVQETSAGEDGFLTRWSRRKHAARNGEAVVDEPTSPAGASQPDPGETSGHEPRELTDQDMPPVESLGENSDYAGFMSPKVSDELRQVALRKLFHLPQFNVTDGLNDYDEDYTTFKELGGIITHEMRRMLEREKERALAADAGAKKRGAPEHGAEGPVSVAPEAADDSSPPAVAGDEDTREDPTEESV